MSNLMLEQIEETKWKVVSTPEVIENVPKGSIGITLYGDSAFHIGDVIDRETLTDFAMNHSRVIKLSPKKRDELLASAGATATSTTPETLDAYLIRAIHPLWAKKVDFVAMDSLKASLRELPPTFVASLAREFAKLVDAAKTIRMLTDMDNLLGNPANAEAEAEHAEENAKFKAFSTAVRGLDGRCLPAAVDAVNAENNRKAGIARRSAKAKKAIVGK